MRLYSGEELEFIPPGDYWVRFDRRGPWYPSFISPQVVGVEVRVAITSGRFNEIGYWPKDGESNLAGVDVIEAYGPLEQPAVPDGKES